MVLEDFIEVYIIFNYDKNNKYYLLQILKYFFNTLDNEMGLCRIYEFIYSYRDSINSPFPELTSQSSVNALEMINSIKRELSTG